jgi:hypothetical protein
LGRGSKQDKIFSGPLKQSLRSNVVNLDCGVKMEEKNSEISKTYCHRERIEDRKMTRFWKLPDTFGNDFFVIFVVPYVDMNKSVIVGIVCFAAGALFMYLLKNLF